MELPPGYRLASEERPSQDDCDVLAWGLEDYNRGFLGDTGYATLGLFVRDKAGTIHAGLSGTFYARWLFVELLWVRADLRRHRIGSGLIAEAERQAVKRGCHSARLDTYSFQAPEFYKKLGYVPFGSIDVGPGHQRIFLQKPLARG